MPQDKDPKKKKITTDKEKKRMSRGQKRYMLMSDIKKSQEEYESEVSEEKGKAEKRSLWSTVGGVLGAGIGVMAAPMVLGGIAALGTAAGVAALTGGAASLATGVGTGLLTGGLSYAGGKGGKAGAESGGTLGGKAKRGKVDVEKFYTKAGEEATETFKDYDKSIDKRIKQQAIFSGALAGFLAGGGFKKVGELTKKGLGIGEKAGAGTTFTTEGVSALEETYSTAQAGPGAGKAGVRTASSGYQGGSYKDALSVADTKILERTISSADPTFAFGPTSNGSLYSMLRENIGKNVFSSGVGAGLSLLQNPVPTIAGSEDEVDLPSYT